MKNILPILLISILACGDSATKSTIQAPETPSASTSANAETPSAPEASTGSASSAAPKTAAAPSNTQQSPTPQTSISRQTPLLGTRWILLELNGKNMEGKTAKEMYLMLDPNSPQFKSHSGCNLVTGEAKRVGNNQLLFTNLINTTSECKTPDIDAEFQKAITDVTGYTLKGNVLELTKKGNVTVLKYVSK